MVANRIVLLGDSLGVAREDEGIEVKDIYPCLLQELLSEWNIVSACRASNRADKQAKIRLLNQDVTKSDAAIVVIQLGICDASPRLFNRYESYALSKAPVFIRERIIRFFSRHRYFFTKHFRKVYVKKPKYEASIRKIINAVLKINALPIVVGITYTNQQNLNRSFHFKENIDEYNSILRTLCDKYKISYIDMSEQGEDILLDDGIHLNKHGSMVFSQKIATVVSNIQNYVQK